MFDNKVLTNLNDLNLPNTKESTTKKSYDEMTAYIRGTNCKSLRYCKKNISNIYENYIRCVYTQLKLINNDESKFGYFNIEHIVPRSIFSLYDTGKKMERDLYITYPIFY